MIREMFLVAGYKVSSALEVCLVDAFVYARIQINPLLLSTKFQRSNGCGKRQYDLPPIGFCIEPLLGSK